LHHPGLCVVKSEPARYNSRQNEQEYRAQPSRKDLPLDLIDSGNGYRQTFPPGSGDLQTRLNEPDAAT